LSGNLCRKCGERLDGEFHSDPKVPFSKGGLTIIQNGQALCPPCNLKKGNNLEPS
jgi:5-methylcytosine-specific restriction endonuclease McrA